MCRMGPRTRQTVNLVGEGGLRVPFPDSRHRPEFEPANRGRFQLVSIGRPVDSEAEGTIDVRISRYGQFPVGAASWRLLAGARLGAGTIDLARQYPRPGSRATAADPIEFPGLGKLLWVQAQATIKIDSTTTSAEPLIKSRAWRPRTMPDGEKRRLRVAQRDGQGAWVSPMRRAGRVLQSPGRGQNAPWGQGKASNTSSSPSRYHRRPGPSLISSVYDFKTKTGIVLRNEMRPRNAPR